MYYAIVLKTAKSDDAYRASPFGRRRKPAIPDLQNRFAHLPPVAVAKS